MLRTGCIGYPCVTRKSNCYKEIRPGPLPRTGCIDYSCVTRKSNCCKEMNVSGAVPVIPVSHVSFIAPTTYGRMKFSRPTQVWRSARQEVVVADGCHSPSSPGFRHLSLAINVVSLRDRTPLEFATELAFARFLVGFRSAKARSFAGAKGDFTPTPSSCDPQST